MKPEKRKEYLIKKNLKTDKLETEQVPVGTQKGLQLRIASLLNKKGLAYAGFEQLYDLRKKIYNVRQLTGENLITFRPPHDQNLKITLANAHESDPYMKRQTGFYTKYVFGDEIRPRLSPLQIDIPKSKGENDDLVEDVITSKEHKGFMKFVAQVNYMSNIHGHMQNIWNQSFVFGYCWRMENTIFGRNGKFQS